LKLTEWMTARKWTCERLASELGVSMVTVWKWRSGTRPEFENIMKIRKLSRGKVREEDWPAKGARPERVHDLAMSPAKRLTEAKARLSAE
jgi:transcriptional regulator with XRE-family HTH domain